MTAAHILQRDAHRYEIKVNIDAWDNVTFELTYEELLERSQDRYQHWVSIAPSQIVNNLRTVINVSDTRELDSKTTKQNHTFLQFYAMF